MRRRTRLAWSAVCLIALAGLASCDTADPLPDAPQLRGPADSTAFDLESAISLIWEPVLEATSYRVEVARTPGFGTLVDSARTGNPAATVGPFPKGTYYWRVVPLAPGGAEGRPSADSYFIVEDQRDLLGARLTWTYSVSRAAPQPQVEIVSASDGGLPQQLAARRIPAGAQVREVVFRRVTLRRNTPAGGGLSQIGTSFLFLMEQRPGSFVPVASLDDAPGFAGIEMVILNPPTLAVEQTPRTALRVAINTAQAPEVSEVEVAVEADLKVVVP